MTKYLANTPTYKFYRRYKCRFCDTKFVILPTETGSALPIEGEAFEEDTIFDPKVHKSHLLDCPECRDSWNEKLEKMHKAYLHNKRKEEKNSLR